MEEDRLRDSDRSGEKGRLALAGLSDAQEDGFLLLPALVPFPQLSSSSPQHICVVTETYLPEINGVALTLANLLKGLIARGHRVSVVHPKQRNQPASNELRQDSYSDAIRSGVTVTRLPRFAIRSARATAPAANLEGSPSCRRIHRN